jgi:Holliday junction resolvase-like predicted endonuclease
VKGEFDIIMYNGKSVALIEVKYKAQKADLEEMVTTKVPVFRTLFPQYKDHTINLGIASLSFDKFVIKKAKELGIGTLTQKGNTIEIDTENIRAYYLKSSLKTTGYAGGFFVWLVFLRHPAPRNAS